MIIIKGSLYIPSMEFELRFARSSGPGGQNVNKVNSKAILIWNISNNRSLPRDAHARCMKAYQRRINSEGQLIIMSDRFRDRPKNIADCEEKLRNMILKVLEPPKPRKPSKPTKASKEKRIAAKKSRSDLKKNRQKISI